MTYVIYVQIKTLQIDFSDLNATGSLIVFSLLFLLLLPLLFSLLFLRIKESIWCEFDHQYTNNTQISENSAEMPPPKPEQFQPWLLMCYECVHFVLFIFNHLFFSFSRFDQIALFTLSHAMKSQMTNKSSGN